MATRQLTWGAYNWYATFEGLPNVVALIPRKSERIAGLAAQDYADRFGAKSVTLRKLHPRGKKT